MEKELKQILTYRSWQISHAYERIYSADRYNFTKEDLNAYYEAIMDLIFFAHEDIMKFEEDIDDKH